MKHELPVFIDRLRDGRMEKIKEELDPKRLDIIDEDIDCKGPVKVAADCYLAEDFLIISMHIEAELTLHCRVCNEPFTCPIVLEKIDQEIPLDEIDDAVFELLDVVREVLLVEVPYYPQCGGDHCKNRSQVEKYFVQEHKRDNPFESL